MSLCTTTKYRLDKAQCVKYVFTSVVLFFAAVLSSQKTVIITCSCALTLITLLPMIHSLAVYNTSATAFNPLSVNDQSTAYCAVALHSAMGQLT
jgi:hypothetical protein